MFYRSHLLAAFLGSAVFFGAPVSHASLFDVTLSADILTTDFTINDADVFGITPVDTSFSVTLRVDTSAGVDSAAAGDATDSFTFGHDAWGYSASVLSASFGSKTWTDSDIVLLNFGDGIDDSQLFLDAELGSGAAPTLASFRVEDGDGFAFFGVRACGITCDILQGLQVRDFNGGSLSSSTNDFIVTTSYSIGVSAVPEPTTTALLALGVLGAGFARKRRAH